MNEQFEKWLMVASSGNADLTLNIRGEYDSPDTFAFYELYKLARTELEQQLAAVVAENAGLKRFCKNAALDADYEAELCMEQGGFTDALDEIKTPATDAAIANIQAQGVEMLLASLPAHYTARADIESFAAQLRQGAAL